MGAERQNGWNEWSKHVLALLESHDNKLDAMAQKLAVTNNANRSDLHNATTEIMHEIGSIRQEMVRISATAETNKSDTAEIKADRKKEAGSLDDLQTDVAKLQERMTIAWGFVALIISSMIGVAIKVFGG